MSTPDLSSAEIEAFIDTGFLRIEGAFSSEIAERGRRSLWRESGCDPNDPATWTEPVIRLDPREQEPFALAVNAPRLRAAYDALVGAGNWLPRGNVGTFVLRFPHTKPPDDTGWHVDASFPGDDPADYWSARINVDSRGRALLMLFLFSDVADDDAPTRIRAGSHATVARILAPFAESGLSFMELASRLDETAMLPEARATGEAGTVYLCHPFLVHAAQAHHGRLPRFMAQPPLLPARPLEPRRDGIQHTPVERAIRHALHLG